MRHRPSPEKSTNVRINPDTTLPWLTAVLVLLTALPTWMQAAPANALSEAEPLAVTPEMRAWLERRVPAAGTPETRWRRLAAALLAPADLRLVEDDGATLTAAQVFASRRGNCVAFAHLAVALARELGLPATFVLFSEPQKDATRGDLRVVEHHMAAALGDGRERTILDFGGLRRPRQAMRPISDATARAIFCSNRGAEALLAGHPEGALAWLRAALRFDPELVDAWINLGVAARRSGLREEALAATRRALEIAPRFAALRQNLAALGATP